MRDRGKERKSDNQKTKKHSTNPKRRKKKTNANRHNTKNTKPTPNQKKIDSTKIDSAPGGRKHLCCAPTCVRIFFWKGRRQLCE